MSYRLLITDGLHKAGMDLLLSSSSLVSVDVRNGVSPDELLELSPHYDGLIIHVATKIDAAVLKASKGRLKFIGCASVGFDHVDLKAAAQFGVAVESSAGANAGSVGDLTLALILSMARRLPEAKESLAKGHWNRKELTGFALSEKTLGLLGAGNTGRAAALRASACGMTVIAYDPKYVPGTTTVAGVDKFVESKEALLSEADIVSLHVPRQPDTLNLIDEAALKIMKSGSYLINTSRGGIANETAVKLALDSSKLAGYGTDVFQVEPLPEIHWMRQHPRVVATPHLGGATPAARKAVSLKIAHSTLAFFKALKP